MHFKTGNGTSKHAGKSGSKFVPGPEGHQQYHAPGITKMGRRPTPVSQGSPEVEVSADPMYTKDVTRSTGESYNPMSGKTHQPSAPGMQAQVGPGFSSGGPGYPRNVKAAKAHLKSTGQVVNEHSARKLATQGVPVRETVRRAMGTGQAQAPEVTIAREPAGANKSVMGSATIPTGIADRFDSTHGSSRQMDEVRQRQGVNLAPRMGGR